MYQVMYHVEDRLTFQAQRQVQYLAICPAFHPAGCLTIHLAFCPAIRLAIRIAVDQVMFHVICFTVDQVNCLSRGQSGVPSSKASIVPSTVPHPAQRQVKYQTMYTIQLFVYYREYTIRLLPCASFRQSRVRSVLQTVSVYIGG